MAIRRIWNIFKNVSSRLVDRALAPKHTETEVLPNGQTQTYEVTGFLRSRTILTLIATGLIGIFNWSIAAPQLVEILLHVVELGGLILAGEFRRRAEVVLK